MQLHIDAFANGQPIPIEHTRDGSNLSPALRWTDLPPGTRELALIVDDPDAPTTEPFIHWVAYKIRPDAGGLPEGVDKKPSPGGAVGAQGKNHFPDIGYDGPEPPRGHGTHRYHFRLYALDRKMEVEPRLDNKALLAAMAGHILAETEVVGTYER